MLLSLPVLMYHSISRFKHKLCVSPELFEDHCLTLAKAGWRGVRLQEAEEFFLKKRKLPRKVCLFTFDDGYLDNYVYAEPILRRYGHHGAIFPIVAGLADDAAPRPTMESLASDPEAARLLPDMDKRILRPRLGCRVYQIHYCNWSELKRMDANGNLVPAPHSLRHDRVVSSLSFKSLYIPSGGVTCFGTPPYVKTPWGFPRFNLGHALANRGYTLAPELFTLVEDMVPQKAEDASAFLKKTENRQAVMDAIAALPHLGDLESEEEYRRRIGAEFRECMEIFTRRLGRPPVSFCWPWGDYNAIALKEARAAGFKVFFATTRGANLRGHAKAVHRIAVRTISGDELLKTVRFASNSILETSLGWLSHARGKRPRTPGN